jgi:hypothetical protein
MAVTLFAGSFFVLLDRGPFVLVAEASEVPMDVSTSWGKGTPSPLLAPNR